MPRRRPTSSGSSASNSTSSSVGFCAKPRVRITEVDVGAAIDANEDEAALKVVAIAALPSGGSRIAFQSGDSIIVRELDANDKLVSSSTAVKVPLHDFADIYADKNGFVILGTRDAEGGGTLNCGNPSNLCGSAPSPAVPCYDMYMVRYDGTSEKWATKLTSSSASLPPYSSGKTGPDVYMIWWYAHHGRIAFDGTNWAAYFGAAISTSEGGCINIHQGDRMKVVNPSGSITDNKDSFDWGCSHSGYERITYDERSKGFASICKTDSNNRLMPPNNWDATISPGEPWLPPHLGDIVPDSVATSNKYWSAVSNGDGDNAKVHLIHYDLKSKASEDIVLGGTDANERAPHLAPMGKDGMLAMWEGSSSGGDLQEGGDRTIYAQVLNSATGKAISSKITVDKSVVGNRYQALKSYPDGSVAYLSKGKTGTSVQVRDVGAGAHAPQGGGVRGGDAAARGQDQHVPGPAAGPDRAPGPHRLPQARGAGERRRRGRLPAGGQRCRGGERGVQAGHVQLRGHVPRGDHARLHQALPGRRHHGGEPIGQDPAQLREDHGGQRGAFTVVEGTGHTGVGSIVDCNNATDSGRAGRGHGARGQWRTGLGVRRPGAQLLHVQGAWRADPRRHSEQGAGGQGGYGARVLPQGDGALGRQRAAHWRGAQPAVALEPEHAGLRGAVPDQDADGPLAALPAVQQDHTRDGRLRRFLAKLTAPDFEHTLFVTHVSRNDIILGFLSHAQNFELMMKRPYGGGLILTGSPSDDQPQDYIMNIIKNAQAPVLYVPTTTFAAMEKITHFTGTPPSSSSPSAQVSLVLVVAYLQPNSTRPTNRRCTCAESTTPATSTSTPSSPDRQSTVDYRIKTKTN
ncbi:hypothetical protein ON010_g15822 [Phytophthora cinnamomi]|nr:hypothetical protein ON010_g15822 [Phytophthora cinnamomi]